MPHTERVLTILGNLRMHLSRSEYDIHRAIKAQLTAAGIPFDPEVKLGPRARIDFVVEGGLGIEVKKGKVGSTPLRAQAKRYVAFDQINELILVVERCVFAAPRDLGKPVHYIALSKNWGIAT